MVEKKIEKSVIKLGWPRFGIHNNTKILEIHLKFQKIIYVWASIH